MVQPDSQACEAGKSSGSDLRLLFHLLWFVRLKQAVFADVHVGSARGV